MTSIFMTSFFEAEPIDLSRDGPSVFDGKRYILYHADATSEIAFIVPGLLATNEKASNKAPDPASDCPSQQPRASPDSPSPNSSSVQQVPPDRYFGLCSMQTIDCHIASNVLNKFDRIRCEFLCV